MEVSTALTIFFACFTETAIVSLCRARAGRAGAAMSRSQAQPAKAAKSKPSRSMWSKMVS